MQWMLSMVMLALVSPSAPAQSDSAATGWTPTLVVRAVPSRPNGARSAAVSGDRKLVKGETARATIWSSRNLCSLGIGSAEPMPAAAPTTNVWRMSAEYLGEQKGRHQIRVTSGFTRLKGEESSASTTQTLSLVDGDHVVLDALSEPPAGGCEAHTVTFEAELAMQASNPALARAAYSAELWLVYRHPSGEEARERLVSNLSAEGPAVPFMFNRLPFPLPQLDPRQGNAEAVIWLSGSLRVRPRTNGNVEVDLDVNPTIYDLDWPGKTPSTLSPKRKTLTLKTGETAAVDFPPPASGYSVLALAAGGLRGGVGIARGGAPSAPQPTEPVVVKGDALILNTHVFFRGHKTQLLITLKPLR